MNAEFDYGIDLTIPFTDGWIWHNRETSAHQAEFHARCAKAISDIMRSEPDWVTSKQICERLGLKASAFSALYWTAGRNPATNEYAIGHIIREHCEISTLKYQYRDGIYHYKF